MKFNALIPLGILFLVLTLVNLFFRRKILRAYKKLAKNKVKFGWSHIWNNKKMQTEIYPHYSKSVQKDIEEFIKSIRTGLYTFITLLSLIFLGSYIYLNFFI